MFIVIIAYQQQAVTIPYSMSEMLTMLFETLLFPVFEILWLCPCFMKDFAHFSSATRLCTFRNDLLCCRRGTKKFSNFNSSFPRFQKHLPFYHNVAGGHQKRFVSFWKLFFIERSACYFIVAGGYQQVFHF